MHNRVQSHWHRKMQSIRSEMPQSVRTAQRSNGDAGREPMKTTEGKLKLAGKKKDKEDKGSKTE